MALERSVLTEQDARALLRAHYGLQVTGLEHLSMGTANCYKVCAEGGLFFLKEFPSSYAPEDVLREHALLDHLTTRSFPVARILPTVENAPYFQHNGHVFCLQEFIEGRTFGYDDFPAELLPLLAQTLGRLHGVLRGYPLSCYREDKWFDPYPAEEMRAEYLRLLPMVSDRDPFAGRICDDLSYKGGLVLRCAEHIPLCRGVTFTASHGDFQGCQLICEGDHLKAVTDFSAANMLPAVWEVMRSFTQSSQVCRDTARIDPDALAAYVREYMRFSPLSRNDLRAMPYVYLMQLARSKYGYPQYLRGELDENSGLLYFAFWRTDICRDLETKAESISRTLQKLI